MKKNSLLRIVIFFLICISGLSAQTSEKVTAKIERLTFPTYKLGQDEVQMMFKEYRLPGDIPFRSSRLVYPYTLQDEFTNNRVDREYEAVVLENEFIKVIVMPELRGRLQAAIDKRNGWDFLYFNRVIKPADISTRQAWLSGGLEWNHPGGHGYTQFAKASYKILEEDDGSKTVVVGEIEPNRMMKWEMAITLRPGRLFVETTGRLTSSVDYPIPFASFQNAAMRVTELSEFIYPKGTWITPHGKGHFVQWPVANGIDYSKLKNIKSGFSAFAESDGINQDFFGVYAHDRLAGTVVVADHRTAPGKKYFSWGINPDGREWDTLLTDNDGGYLELQLGAFWDNLGYGYAWLNPTEEKEFTAYWYPLKDIGGFVEATKDIALNVKVDENNKFSIGVQATKEFKDVKYSVFTEEKVLAEESINLKLSEPFIKTIVLGPDIDRENIKVQILDNNGKSLIVYDTRPVNNPSPKSPEPGKPLDLLSADDLYIKGKSDYQDPFSPRAESYYNEMLKRDSLDYRANLELGKFSYHRGLNEMAKFYFQNCLSKEKLNQAGYESYLYLGLIEFGEGNYKDAGEYLGLASRFEHTKSLAMFYLGNIELINNDPENSLLFYKEALRTAGNKAEIWSYIAIAYRKLGMNSKAETAIKNALNEDPLEFTAITEQWIANIIPDEEINSQFDRRDSTFVGSQLYIEEASKYLKIGCLKEAADILNLGINYFAVSNRVFPMLHYYLGYVYDKLGNKVQAKNSYAAALKINSKYEFPYRLLSIKVFDNVLSYFPRNEKAWYYKGSILTYRRRHAEGFEAWQKAYILGLNSPVLLRNLAQAEWYLNKDSLKTLKYLREAQQIDPQDSRIFYDLDFMNDYCMFENDRIAQFENNRQMVIKNDPLVHRWVALLLRLGNRNLNNDKIAEAYSNYKQANELMKHTYFFPREASESLHERYAETFYGLAEIKLLENKPEEALKNLKSSLEYPTNLNEGRKHYPVRTRAFFLMGLAYDQLKDADSAKKYFQMAVDEKSLPYSETVCIQAVSLQKLSKNKEAINLLYETKDQIEKSIEHNSQNKTANNYFVLGKIYSELGDNMKAKEFNKIAFDMDPDVVLNSRLEACSIRWEGKL